MVIIAGILRAKRRNELFGATMPRLTDAQIRQMEERGWVDVEEPLDYEEIDDEQARFWEESKWDEPEEF
jgi:hypothetical protein